ncbi:MAG TPA: hypothetical protein VKD72_00490, partial [Gemmataceae bacterium]|nr:hypothetical protein [Gemmataceae bacterium]
ALNCVHAARRAGRELSAAEKKQVFEQSFLCEQEVTVAPGVEAAVGGFDCPILKFLCLRPLVRFAFFPNWQYLFFRNFADKQERIEKGLLAYDYAERGGWSHVHDALRRYGRMPAPFFESPEKFMEEVRRRNHETHESHE